MWFNVPKARAYLLKYGFVYTLRPKKGRLRGRLLEGEDILSYEGFGKKGEVYFWYVCEIPDKDELADYVCDSGFDSVDEWAVALEKGQRSLYLVILLRDLRA